MEAVLNGARLSQTAAVTFGALFQAGNSRRVRLDTDLSLLRFRRLVAGHDLIPRP